MCFSPVGECNGAAVVLFVHAAVCQRSPYRTEQVSECVLWDYLAQRGIAGIRRWLRLADTCDLSLRNTGHRGAVIGRAPIAHEIRLEIPTRCS